MAFGFDHEAGMKNVKDGLQEAGQGMSKALMGGAFESFGKAFGGGGYTPRGQKPDQGHMSNWREMGRQTQKALENRWHMAEWATFRKTHLKEYENNLKGLMDNNSSLVQSLNEGKWPNENVEGGFEVYDLNNEKDRMKVLRLKNTLESETFRSVMDMQLGLNNVAMEKYYNNPIVGGMIEKMMLKQTEMLQGQFNMGKNSREQAKGELDIENTNADIRVKNATAGQMERKAKKDGALYEDITEAHGNMTPAEFVDFATNNPKGRELLNDSTYTDYLAEITQSRREEFRKGKDWSDLDAQTTEHRAMEEEFIAANLSRFKQRAFGEFVQGEFGPKAYSDVVNVKEGIGKDVNPPHAPEITVMPSKKEVKELVKDWNTLGTELANREMRKDNTLSKDDAIDWLMDDWFDKAMEGNSTDREGVGGYISELDGMTADWDNKVVRPYIKEIRDQLRKYAEKWVGTGPGTDQLLENQKPPRKSQSRGAVRSRMMERGAGVLLDAVTPDSLFPNAGKGLYAESFKERHPKPTKSKRE